jgi:Uma2 family endonuclease
MEKRLVLSPETLPATLLLNRDVQIADDDSFFEFCMNNPDLRIERTEEGEIVILAPMGFESAWQASEIAAQLANWAKIDRRGKAFGLSEFILPTRAALSPNAAWVSGDRVFALSKEQRRTFLAVCPEFVIEVMSPSDRLKRRSTEDAGLDSWGCRPWLVDLRR